MWRQRRVVERRARPSRSCSWRSFGTAAGCGRIDVETNEGVHELATVRVPAALPVSPPASSAEPRALQERSGCATLLFSILAVLWNFGGAACVDSRPGAVTRNTSFLVLLLKFPKKV